MTDTQIPSPSGIAVADGAEEYLELPGAAVLILILGLLSPFSLAPHWAVWLIPMAAIATGSLALRRIAQAPDERTGRKQSWAGIGIGAFFLVATVCTSITANMAIKWHAHAVADRFANKILDQDVEAAFWLTVRKKERDGRVLKVEEVTMKRRQEYLRVYTEFLEAMGPMLARLSKESQLEFLDVIDVWERLSDQYVALRYQMSTPGTNTVVILRVEVAQVEKTGNWYVFKPFIPVKVLEISQPSD